MLAALLALGSAARASVIVVDSMGGGDYTTISAAIAAAADGDTVLIRPGFYTTGIFVDGTSLVIVGDPAGVNIGDNIVMPANGGDGCAAIGSKVLLSGCGATGGLPGLGVGGNGLSLDAGSIVHLLDDTLVPEAGGSPIANAGGVVDAFAGLTRTFELTSPLREGQSGTLHVQGVQGDFVGFFWSFNSGSLPMPARNGWFVLSTSFFTGPYLLGGITDAGGVWDLPIHGPNLPPASLAQTFLLQAYFAYTGGVTLSSGTAFTLVDASL